MIFERKPFKMTEMNKHWLTRIPLNIWIVSVVTLLVNLSSIMIFTLWPLYITHVFGLSIFRLGLLEGVIEFGSWCIRICAGVVSDILKKRKPVFIFAYTLIALTRPIFALAPGLGWVYGARLTDRLANGLQATPREALVGDSAPADLKGACFGLRQSLGVVGSLLGALFVMLLMHKTDNHYQTIFWYASIPTCIALLIIVFFLHEKQICPKEVQEVSEPPLLSRFRSLFDLNAQFWILAMIAGVFMISNYSGIYRVLQAERMNIPLSDISLIMVVQNLGAMLAGLPIGKLSDKFDRRIFLSIGFVFTILSNLCFGTHHEWLFFCGAVLWGVQMGITQSILLTMVADTTKQSLRGTAFGIYYFINAVALFMSDTLTGYLFDVYGPFSAFCVSATIAGVCLFLVPLIKLKSREPQIVDGIIR